MSWAWIYPNFQRYLASIPLLRTAGRSRTLLTSFFSVPGVDPHPPIDPRATQDDPLSVNVRHFKVGVTSLTKEEADFATEVGIKRNREAIKQGRSNQWVEDSSPERSEAKHIEGALGECGFCKLERIYWDADINTYKTKIDCGGYEVRTCGRNNWRLIVRDDDPPDRKFALVGTILPRVLYSVNGWCYGYEGRVPQWRDRPPGGREAHFVPYWALHRDDPVEPAR